MIARLQRVRIAPSSERSHGDERPEVMSARSLVAVTALAVLAAGCSDKAPGTLQGYVEGDFVHVASPYAGYLDSLAVQRGAQVAAGAKLFVLEHATEQAAVDAAAARFARRKPA
jgi:HlyD family secretion protein